MKIFILIICLASTSAFAQIGKVPSDWISPDDTSSFKGFVSETAETSQLDLAYQNILDTQMKLFESIPDDSHKRWHLQSIKTELAVEPFGTIGVLGVGGEAALEFVWIKKNTKGSKDKLQLPVLNEVIDSEDETVQITSGMSEETMMKEISPIVDLAMATGHVKGRKKLFKNLFAEALKFQDTVKELESSPAMGPWYAYKYQLELYISAAGKVSVVEIGNSLRLRLEWWRLKKNEAQETVSPIIPTELSDNAKFIASIASDFESVDEVDFSNGFRLNAIKVGIGKTVKGNLYFVKGKAKAVGSIFFKRDETPPSLHLPSFVDDVNSYRLYENGKTNEIPRFNFRNGIKKGAKISQYFSSKAKTKGEGQFELNVIETELEIFLSGGIGIVTVKGSAGITMFVTRNVSI